MKKIFPIILLLNLITYFCFGWSYPQLSETEAWQIIESTCDKVGGYFHSGQDSISHSFELGYGHVNAHEAVLAEQNLFLTCTSPTSLSSSSITDNSAIINYSQVSGAQGYVLEYRIVGTSAWTGLMVLESVSFMPLNFLQSCTTYEVRLSTICQDGWSDPSAIHSFTTTGCIEVCDAPTNLEVINIMSNSVTITYTQASGALGYNLRYREVGTSGWNGIGVSAPVPQIIVTSLVPCTNYEVQVSTECLGNNSFYSESEFFTTSGCVPLTSMINILHPISCAGNSDGSLEAVVTGGVPPYQYSWSNGKESSVNDHLSAGTYTLTVIDSNGDFLIENITLSEPDPLESFTSSTPVSNGQTNGTATVSCSGGVLPYNFLWQNGMFTSTIENLDAGVYLVTITDNNGCSKVDTAIVSVILGLDETTTLHTELILFPNPAVYEVTVKVPAFTRPVSSIRLYSLSGQLMTNWDLNSLSKNEFQLELPSELSSGHYILRVLSEDQVFIKKLIVVQ